MVFNGKRFAALEVDGSDVLLYFLEPALDFPACGIKLNHLFCCKRKVGGDQRESESFVIYENDLDLTSERLGRAEQLGELDVAVFAVNMDHGRSCELAQLSGKTLDRCELSAELRAASAFAWNKFRHLVENGGDVQARQHEHINTGICRKRMDASACLLMTGNCGIIFFNPDDYK